MSKSVQHSKQFYESIGRVETQNETLRQGLKNLSSELKKVIDLSGDTKNFQKKKAVIDKLNEAYGDLLKVNINYTDSTQLLEEKLEALNNRLQEYAELQIKLATIDVYKDVIAKLNKQINDFKDQIQQYTKTYQKYQQQIAIAMDDS